MRLVTAHTRPLFRFDPGWLFVMAGVAICAAGVLLPAQSDLQGLHNQLGQLQNEETRAYARLKAHSDFMDQVDRADPALIRRLAATQLNIIPEGETPVLLAAGTAVPVTHWIEAAVNVDIRPPKAAPTTTLSKLANGPHRLWMFGAGIMAVFLGLLLGPASVVVDVNKDQPHHDEVVEDHRMTHTESEHAGGHNSCDEDSIMHTADVMEELNWLESDSDLLTADHIIGVNEIPLDDEIRARYSEMKPTGPHAHN